MANNVKAQEALTEALKACPRGSSEVLTELHTAIELALRSSRSNRGVAHAKQNIQEALDALADPAVDEEARETVGTALRSALAYMEGNRGYSRKAPAEAPKTRRSAARRPAGRRRPSGVRRPRGGGRRSRRMPATPASDASPIEAVLERSSDGTTTIRVALRPDDLRALVKEVLG